jgi:Holliday junction resolvase
MRGIVGRKRILGKTTDFITGREIKDTDDERLRQRIARFLVEEKGYVKEDIEVKRRIEMQIEGKKIRSMVDFVVTAGGASYMVIKYGPGSLVTRERPALAIARILEEYEIPLTVVTNGEDAEVLETATGTVISTGIDSIPEKAVLIEQYKLFKQKKISPHQIEAEKRVLSAYDYLEHSLECDDDWCETG